jgi:hypothetical protein
MKVNVAEPYLGKTKIKSLLEQSPDMIILNTWASET